MSNARNWALGLLWSSVAVAPVLACGPFLFDNSELDRFSLLEPSMLTSSAWNPYLAYDSPSYGFEPAADQGVVQYVLQPERLPLFAPSDVSNLLYEAEPGQDPVSVAANEAWWRDYFAQVRQRAVRPAELSGLLYEGARPRWLTADDRRYLDLLKRDPDDRAALRQAKAAAQDSRLPSALRHRYFFWAVRALTLLEDPDAVAWWRQNAPAGHDLPLARAQGWAASALAFEDPAAARDLWVDLLVRWPALRAQTFASLLTLPPAAWEGATSPQVRMAHYFVEGRDFSPETLMAMASAEHTAGGNGEATEAMLFSMAQQVEAEAGVFALFAFVDPHATAKPALFTTLIDAAESLVMKGTQPATRTWWVLASYLCLFDGDLSRAATLLQQAQKLPAVNTAQEHQTELVAALIEVGKQAGRDWSPELQTRLVKALDWAEGLNAVDHNRGLYHSLVVLIAQKSLAQGRSAEAALAFGLIQEGPWSNPYRLAPDDGFWASGIPTNNPVNLMFDALLTDEDLQAWRRLLRAADLPPLTARLVAHPFLSSEDLTWWEAHRALRRGNGAQAQKLLAELGAASAPGSSWFPAREFSYSLDLDPLHPESGQGMTTVSPLKLAAVMTAVEAEAQARPSARSLLADGEFWFSLQLSGLPLLFAQPPTVISFVNGNFEYYGYDGRDQDRSLTVVADYPLAASAQRSAWPTRLAGFYQDEFTALPRAKRAFEAVLRQGGDPEAEYRALLFLAALGTAQPGLADARFDDLPLAQEFRTTCEAFQ